MTRSERKCGDCGAALLPPELLLCLLEVLQQVHWRWGTLQYRVGCPNAQRCLFLLGSIQYTATIDTHLRRWGRRGRRLPWGNSGEAGVPFHEWRTQQLKEDRDFAVKWVGPAASRRRLCCSCHRAGACCCTAAAGCPAAGTARPLVWPCPSSGGICVHAGCSLISRSQQRHRQTHCWPRKFILRQCKMVVNKACGFAVRSKSDLLLVQATRGSRRTS